MDWYPTITSFTLLHKTLIKFFQFRFIDIIFNISTYTYFQLKTALANLALIIPILSIKLGHKLLDKEQSLKFMIDGFFIIKKK